MSQSLTKSVLTTPATSAVAAETATAGVSTLTYAPAPSVSEFSVPFRVSMDGTAKPQVRLALRSNVEFRARTAFFESVELLGIDFVCRILPGSSRQIWWAFDAYNIAFPTDLLACPIAGMDSGASYNTIAVTGTLPSDHPFGRQIKGANLGTPSPDLFLRYVGGQGQTTMDVIVRIDVRVRCSGNAPVSAISL